MKALQKFRKLTASELAACSVTDYRGFIPIANKVLITCEHASNNLPSPYQWSEKDNQFRDMHWGYDIGALEIAERTAQRLECMMLSSNISRLLLDQNRWVVSKTLIRDVCDGQVLDLNKDVDQVERLKRINAYHLPYHLIAGELVQFLQPSVILSIHSFTDNYQGQKRDIEVGVLYDSPLDKSLADEYISAHTNLGYDTRANEPWSVEDGATSMASSLRTALGIPIPSFIFEYRQDLTVLEKDRTQFVDALVDVTINFLAKTI